MKKIIYILAIAAISLAVRAEENAAKTNAQLIAGISEGVLKARLEAACLKQVDKSGRTVVLNKEECLIEVTTQIKLTDNHSDLIDYRNFLVSFKSKNIFI